jgi:16S rRNA processing protein RimM
MNRRAGSDLPPAQTLIVMGRVQGPYGVKGWIKVEPYTERAQALGHFGEWWLRRENGWERMALAEWAPHGPHIVARLADFSDRDTAAALRGAEIAVPREALPPTAENEFYQADLIGLEVLNRTGDRLGRVERIFGNAAHEVMSLRWEGGERLIPFVAPVVDGIDLEARVIHVDWGADW